MPEFGDWADRRTRLALIAIVLIAFALRISFLDQKSLWWDESATLSRVRDGFRFVVSNQMKWGENLWLDNHPPLHAAFIYLFVKLAGDGDFAIRYPSAAWGVLLSALLYPAGKRLINKRAGVLAALIGALSPFYLWFSQSARMHILVPLLGLLSVTLLWQILEGKPWPWHVAFVASNAALLFTHVLGLSLVLFEGLVVVVHWLRHRNWRLVITMAAVSLCAVPVIQFSLPRSGQRIREDLLPLSLIFRDVVHSYNAGLSWSALTLRWWDWCMLALVVVGALVLVERNRRARIARSLFLSGYALIPFLLLWLVPALNMHYMGARYAVIGSPAFYLLLAAGLETLLSKVRRAFIPAASLVMVIFSVSTYRYFYVPPYTLHRGHDYRSAAQYVNDHAYPGDALVGSPYSYEAFYRYIEGDLPWYGLPRRPYWDDETFVRDSVPEFQALQAQYDRIWFIDADYLYVEQKRGTTKSWLNDHLIEFTVQPYAYVTAHGYLTQSPFVSQWPPQATPLDVTFEDRIRVKGYAVPDRAPESGAKTRVVLYLESLQDLDADYGVAIRVHDQEGRIWGERMQPILAGIHPTSHWQRGQRLREWCDVEIAPGTPPGTYHLELGLYRVSPYQGLIAYSNGGSVLGPSVPLDEIHVQSRQTPLPTDAVGAQQPLHVRWGSEIDLLGQNASASSVQAGGVVPLDLYYRARVDLEPGHIARFSLVNHAGSVVWTTDEPLVALPPGTVWHADEVLKGQYALFVPPHIASGRYRITVQAVSAEGKGLAAHRPRWNPLPGARTTLADVDVEARTYETDLPPISHPMHVTLGEWGELLGYDLTQDILAPGDTLAFTLYWRAGRPVAETYKVFVHVLGADGHMGTQSDSMPANWSRPTYTWAPGEPIVDAHQIPLPTEITPGAYRIVVGLYDKQTGQRVPLYNASGQSTDHIELTTLTVQ